MTREMLFDFMKRKYPLLEEKRLKQVISELPKEIKMSERHITSKEFRKLNMITELLSEKYSRDKIKWYCEEDGWSLLIDARYQLISVFIPGDYITCKSVMGILHYIIDAS